MLAAFTMSNEAYPLAKVGNRSNLDRVFHGTPSPAATSYHSKIVQSMANFCVYGRWPLRRKMGGMDREDSVA